MDTISQTTFSSAFSWMKIFEFRLKFHWSLFLRVQLTIFQHWFRKWLGAVQATSHYLNQWWLSYRRIYVSLGLNEFKEFFNVSSTIDMMPPEWNSLKLIFLNKTKKFAERKESPYYRDICIHWLVIMGIYSNLIWNWNVSKTWPTSTEWFNLIWYIVLRQIVDNTIYSQCFIFTWLTIIICIILNIYK